MRNNLIQTENATFFQQMDICCQKVVEKAGTKDLSEWKNSDYINLSRGLRRETKINLSEHTLKRIFGKLKTSSRYYPQKATRDALAQFVGYKDWSEFTLLNPVAAQPLKDFPIELTTTKKRIFIVYAGALLLLGLFSAVITWYNKVGPETANVKLICTNPDGPAPRFAVFKLSPQGKLTQQANLFSVDFADIRSQRSSFRYNLINHYYETPGRYFPVLYYKETPIDTVPVYLRSEGWNIVATMKQDTSRVFPLGNKPENTSLHHVSIKDVFNAGVDTNKTFVVSFANVKPTGISADNFELTALIKTSANRSGVRCSPTNIIVFGERGTHFISIIRPQCAAFASYNFSEVGRTGAHSDLRGMGYDLSNGGRVRMRIANKDVVVSVNERVIFKSKYNKPIGKCMGVKIAFAGIGAFSDFKLRDLKTKQQF